MRTIGCSIVIFLIGLSNLSAQILFEKRFELSSLNSSSTFQLSNSVTDIAIQGDTIWLGTGKGLSRSTDGGRTWKNYYDTPEFGKEDISALAVRGKNIWAATAHSVEKDGQSLPEGTGLRYSSDGGTTWKVIPQPVDVNNVDTLINDGKRFIRALGITTAINNITYDIALTGNTVWICSFAGMARKSTDNGTTWERVIIPPDNLTSIGPNDSLVFDLSPSGGALNLQNNLNHRAFSVMTENDSTIWIGTAGGINKTTDGGISWKKFSNQTQSNPISGNFVVALAKQSSNGKDVIWASTNPTESNQKRGISFSEDGGLNWKQTLIGEFAHNFGFKDDIAYVPTDNGIFRSDDFGNSWTQTGTIYDKANRQRYTQSKFFAANSWGDTAWFGGGDGLIKTIDNATHYFGSNWTISHTSQQVPSQTETYAYPNPFAPDDEVVRIHYGTGKTYPAKVTMRIFDFGMNLVDTPVQNALREANRDHDEIWNGRNQNGTFVTNGVYFYQLVIDNDEPRWGKILVIQ